MNFRDYASKLRSQAEAVASKIPSFDQMAANDEYIHSEEFNFRGQTKSKKLPAEPSADNVLPISGPATDRDDTSMGSWSLLDRPATRIKSSLLPSTIPGKGVAPSDTSSQNKAEFNASSSSNTISSSEAKQEKNQQQTPSSTSLLSVVTHTLQGTYRPQMDSSSESTDTGTDVLDSGYSDGSDQGGIDSDDDEDDPIILLLRDKRNSSGKSSDKSAKAKKSSRRFLDDLDKRLATPMQMEEGEAIAEKKAPSTANTAFASFQNPLEKWVPSIAQRSFQRFLRPTEVSTLPNAPPLAREQKAKKEIPKPPEEEFQATASSSLLADDELAELARLNMSTRKSLVSVLLDSFLENRQFGFILFTLILAIYLFFFRRDDDDVL